jgi:Arc/MetJ-type ribon-helix-helix transcriptional regulator
MAKTRLQFDFSDESLGQLDELKGATGAASRAEVIRQALRLLQWTIEQTQDEKATVLVEKDGRQREVIFPYFPSRHTVNVEAHSNG